jgi:hypothetical protein
VRSIFVIGGDPLKIPCVVATELFDQGVCHIAWATVPALTISDSSRSTATSRGLTFALHKLDGSKGVDNTFTAPPSPTASLVNVLEVLCRPVPRDGASRAAIGSRDGGTVGPGMERVCVVGDVAASYEGLTNFPTTDHIKARRYTTESLVLQDANVAVKDTSILRAHVKEQLTAVIEGRSSNCGIPGLLNSQGNRLWNAIPTTSITLPRQTLSRCAFVLLPPSLLSILLFFFTP